LEEGISVVIQWECRVSLSIPVGGKSIRLSLNCPYCGTKWYEPLPPIGMTERPQGRMERLAVFSEAFHRLRMELDSKSDPTPFTFNLEIAGPKKEGL
jgi:hypothetical protein